MKQRSSVICVLSLIFGIAVYPLSLFELFTLIDVALNRIPDERTTSIIVFFAVAALIAALVISGFVLGLIGIIRQREKKGMAIAGVILTGIKALLSVVTLLLFFVLSH